MSASVPRSARAGVRLEPMRNAATSTNSSHQSFPSGRRTKSVLKEEDEGGGGGGAFPKLSPRTAEEQRRETSPEMRTAARRTPLDPISAFAQEVMPPAAALERKRASMEENEEVLMARQQPGMPPPMKASLVPLVAPSIGVDLSR